MDQDAERKRQELLAEVREMIQRCDRLLEQLAPEIAKEEAARKKPR